MGNKNDLSNQRLVTFADGRKRAEELGCAGYYDISVRECYDNAREVFVDLYKIWKSATLGSRKVLKRQEEIRISPPSPRRRDQRSSLFKHSHSSSTDSDSTSNNVVSPAYGGDNKLEKTTIGMFGFGGEKNMLEVKREVKRKPSVHKRIMMRVMPSFKISKENTDVECVEQS